MPPLRQQMIAALQRSGKGERTQHASVRDVRLLAQFYGTSPALISDPALPHSFLHRKNVDHLAPASMRLCYSAIRCFSPHVLQRDWHTLSLMRAQTAHRLPAVRSVQEVRRLLNAATPLHHPVYFPTVYSLGLRLHDALSLHGADIDGQRLPVHVHRGTGAKDRYVPFPQETLARLRSYWQTPHNPTWLFPATGRDQKHRPRATAPMRRNSVQGACRTATRRAGIPTTGVALHPRRHASATPLREAGVPLRLLQRSLGHTRLATTRVSLPLTHTGHAEASPRLNSLPQGLVS
jgi:integrase/recombinase XerD